MNSQDNQELTYIIDVSDGTGRSYKGYYNSAEDTYILKYTDNSADDIVKDAVSVSSELFSPFYQLKLAHQTNGITANDTNPIKI